MENEKHVEKKMKSIIVFGCIEDNLHKTFIFDQKDTSKLMASLQELAPHGQHNSYSVSLNIDSEKGFFDELNRTLQETLKRIDAEIRAIQN